jgi:hypothetical protein
MRMLTALSLIITIALQCYILALLLRRKLRRRFPWFSVYVLYALIECLIRLVVSAQVQIYFMVYWLTEIADTLLTTAALRESFLEIFWPESRQRWFKWIFWTCIAVTVAYAGLTAWLSPPHQARPLVAGIISFEVGVQSIVAVVGILYFGLIKLFRVMEHQLESGIILGFGMNASLAALGILARSAFGTRFALFSAWLPAVAYIVAEATWVAILLQPERRLPEPNISLEQMNEALDSYIAIVRKYLGRQE